MIACWRAAGPASHARLESLEGLENVEAIAAVEGIDMIAYGHSDLSARLGVHLQLEHPTFKAAVRRIAEACNAHGELARGVGGDRGADRGVLAARVQGVEPARQRRQHLA